MLNKLKKTALLAVAFMFFLLGCGSSYAVVKRTVSVNNSISTGKINIEIKNYTIKNGKKVPLNKESVVDIEKNVSYIPSLTNQGEPCYLRVKLMAEADEKNINMGKYLYGINDGFVERQGYLYYTDVLDIKECISICEGFEPPEEWDYRADNNLKVNIRADVLQAVNFTPDFNLQNPWGSVEAAESQKKDSYTVNTVIHSENCGIVKIVYGNMPEGVSVNAEKFLSDVKFMPGDRHSDFITLTNDSSSEVKIKLRVACKNKELPEVIHMNINNGSEFYNGNMAGKSLEEYKTVAVLAPGEGCRLNAEFELPEYMGNEYQDMQGISTWYFTSEYTSDEGIAKTGDETVLWLTALLCMFCSAVTFMIVRRR